MPSQPARTKPNSPSLFYPSPSFSQRQYLARAGAIVLKPALAILALLTLSACGFLNKKNAYWNEPVGASTAPDARINYQTPNRPGSNIDTLFILALSGGGSRAAVLSTFAMLKLEEPRISTSLMDEVDAISSVSGGSIPAAYYAVSKTANPANCGTETQYRKRDPVKRPLWNASAAIKTMSSNFQGSWIRRWFRPWNVLRFWFTSFDRSDIMAQVFAKKLGSYTFGDICIDKPRVFINATRATYYDPDDSSGLPTEPEDKPSCPPEDQQTVGGVFTFTDCEFDNLDSSLAKFPIANAVVSSSAFPAVFNYTTLRDFTKVGPDRRYLHLYDGGSRDNLGLTTVSQIIEASSESYQRVVVLLVDAYLEPQGISHTLPDARTGFDFFVDTNFLDSIDNLLSTNHDKTIVSFRQSMAELAASTDVDIDTFFYHLSLPDLSQNSLVRDTVNSIKTSFKIADDQVDALRKATDELYAIDDGSCFSALQKMVYGEPIRNVSAVLNGNASCQLNAE